VRRFAFFIFLLSQINGQFVNSSGEISILGIRVSFQEDDEESTTGNGTFLFEQTETRCEDYFLDPPPHNSTYFSAQFLAVDNYFRSVSNGKFGIDLTTSKIVPDGELNSYSLNSTMSYFHPYENQDLNDQRLAEFFEVSLQKAYEIDGLDFNNFDVIVIFHSGIGQDFVLPFLDPTPEDIPSAYIDSDFLLEHLGIDRILFENGSYVSSGIILPETQNHLLYDIAEDIFLGVSNPCDYQFGLTGTFTLMMGFAIGFPPLWDTETGESGVGVFALMDQGSNNGRGVIPAPPDAWTRIYAGWESETLVRPTHNIEFVARDSLQNQIIRVDIRESEYFLIENRNNWIFQGVDIDSLRWRNRSVEQDTFFLPTYVEMLVDSGGVEIDSQTGVILSVPNYDMGLPGSGLLIWHIDEKKIEEGLFSYSVNGEREHRGIDLEEADGAQDIGYPSNFLFTDPSSGFWSDMWFDGNSEYYFANPGFVHQRPSFGPDTYPNTRSNSGSDSYIEINNISVAKKTMDFTVDNSLMADGFPDTSLHIRFFYDFTGDGVPEIIGGQDSLWVAPNRPVQNWDYFGSKFFESPSDSFHILVTHFGILSPKLAVVADIGDSLGIYTFRFDHGEFILDWTQSIESELPPLAKGYESLYAIDLTWGNKGFIVYKDSVSAYHIPDVESFNPVHQVRTAILEPDAGLGGTTRENWAEIKPDGGLSIGERAVGLESIRFSTISAVDLDLDGDPEFIATDQGGSVYCIIANVNYPLKSGFPVHIKARSTVLARDLFGDEHPELVVQVESGDIVILDWNGKEQYSLANAKGNELRMLSNFRARNCIATESTIWLFDSTKSTNGNAWSYEHHNPTNRRVFHATLRVQTPDETELIDVKRTYNYPNPVKDNTTTIRIFVESAEKIDIMIYDLAGFFVDKINLNSPIHGEVNEVVWDVSNVESGVYFVNITASKGNKLENKILKIAVVH